MSIDRNDPYWYTKRWCGMCDRSAHPTSYCDQHDICYSCCSKIHFKEAEVPETAITRFTDFDGHALELSHPIVKQFLVSGHRDAVTTVELELFIQFCALEQLNPFRRDVWLIKYDQGAPASQVIAKKTWLSRGARHPAFKSLQYGTIVERPGPGGELLIAREVGSIVYPHDTLLGAWAKLVRSDRDEPFEAAVMLKEYSTGKSTWANKPATMITKVAVVRVHQEAFPNLFGASGLDTVPEEDVTITVELPDDPVQAPESETPPDREKVAADLGGLYPQPPDESTRSFAHVGELLQAAHQEFSLTRSEVLKIAAVERAEEITDTGAIWNLIRARNALH